MLIITAPATSELIIKKSRFIAIAEPCPEISSVRTLIERTRLQHPRATHVVHAAVVRDQFSFSDDREPKNTAGRPAFEVLRNSGITDICVLIVRYFGGTLLGTGGLVKAYGDSVKKVLENVQTEEFVPKTGFSLIVPYSFYKTVRNLLVSFNAQITDEAFSADISILGFIPEESRNDLLKAVADISGGTVKIRFNC